MYFYSIITEVIFRSFSVLSPLLSILSPRIGCFFSDRKDSLMKNITPSEYVFFCSSAGEYDQIIPILEKLKKQKKTTFIIFFSTSGINYLQKTDADQPHILMPYDSIFYWNKLFKALNPKKIFIVRYEFWPAFLKTASHKPLFLLFWHKQNLQGKNLKKRYYQWCLNHFKLVFCVDKPSQESLARNFQIISSKVLVSGDSKYERALTRKIESNSSLAINHEYTVIGGSVWPEDLDILLPAFKDFTASVKAKLILVPHDISKAMIQKVELACSQHQLTYSTHASLPNHLMHDVTIIQSMGQLAKIYPIANFAFIGGAMHHRVHNVLEAASANLAISFGPHHHTSHEAKLMVKENLVEISGTVNQLHEILVKAHKNHVNGIPTGTLDFMQKYLGASNFIIEKANNLKNL